MPNKIAASKEKYKTYLLPSLKIRNLDDPELTIKIVDLAAPPPNLLAIFIRIVSISFCSLSGR